MRAEQLSTQELKKGILDGNTVTLSRAITLIESSLAADKSQASELLQSIVPYTGKSIRVGISGVPGAGKSTFIEALGTSLTTSGKKVAVLAVDPSSTRTGGSILGDKTRMEKLSKDPLAYVRPTPTGGHSGGVAGKTREAILLCEAAGFHVVLVETVGVGQTEMTVRGMVDFFMLLMIAGAGDELQGIKKGILELADGIAINKADGDNIERARRAQSDLQHALHLVMSGDEHWKAPVLTCSSTTMTGISKIWETIQAFEQQGKSDGSILLNRKSQNLLWMEESFAALIEESKTQSDTIRQRRQQLEQQVGDLSIYPPEGARLLWQEFLKGL
jgi:LAO/AO transport system kinase